MLQVLQIGSCIIAVIGIIQLDRTILRLSFTQQHGTIVCPTGKDSRPHITFLLFSNAEDGPIVIILLNIRVATHIVLVHPCPGKNIRITDG